MNCDCAAEELRAFISPACLVRDCGPRNAGSGQRQTGRWASARPRGHCDDAELVRQRYACMDDRRVELIAAERMA